MKILVFSAHPDDAETGAGGFCARAAGEGHDVLIVHISKEVKDKTYDGVPEREVRVAEAERAAEILGVRVAFLDYLMGECVVTNESSKEVAELIRDEKPQLVLTQWPIDTHSDHQVVGVLPIRLYVYDNEAFDLGFYEVYTGVQTLSFTPNRRVDISGYWNQKVESVLCHASQGPEVQVEMHTKIAIFRGLEIKVPYAEAFHMLGSTTRFDQLFGDHVAYGPSGGFHPIKGRIIV